MILSLKDRKFHRMPLKLGFAGFALLVLTTSSVDAKKKLKPRNFDRANLVLPMKLVQTHSLNGVQKLLLGQYGFELELSSLGCSIYYHKKSGQVYLVNYDKKVYWQGKPKDFQYENTNIVAQFMFPQNAVWKTHMGFYRGLKTIDHTTTREKSVAKVDGFLAKNLKRYKSKVALQTLTKPEISKESSYILARAYRLPDFGRIPVYASSGLYSKELKTETLEKAKKEPREVVDLTGLVRKKTTQEVLYNNKIEDVIDLFRF